MSFDWKKVLEAWKALWARLSTGRRVGVVSLAVAGALLLLGLVYWANRDVYVPLYRGGSTRELSDIVQLLDDNRVPYRTSAGTHVDVPEQHVARMKGLLVKEGLLEDEGGRGFLAQMDESPSLLATPEEKARLELRKQTYRAQEALETLDFVDEARLTTRMEERSYLQRDHKKALATVLIRPRRDHRISPQQALTIRHVVASEIPGLDVSDVTVADNRGIPIAVGGNPAGAMLDDFQMETQARIDQALTAKALEAVSVFPPGSVQVAVHADLDFNVLELKQLESADPDSKRTLREQIDTQTSTEPTVAGGSPGPDSEFGGNDGAAGESSTEKIETTYDYDKRIEKWRNLARYGTNRLSVSLLVHDSLADQKKQIENLVRGAVGFDETRQDTISVEALRYELPDLEVPEEPLFDILELVGFGAEALSVVAVVVMLMVLMLRAIKKQKREEEERLRLEEEARLAEEAAAAAAAQEEEVDIESADPLKMLNQMEKAAREDPASIARLVKHWISEV